ncbi:unnamed protein product [Rhizoctonia solani]|uniref:Uncharacterized protein n=1 Tax=Rhizoctonia solani TaxID=456999 RepID=A0A8H3CLP9_9AGAM|nr:unnamed protein product [Rhizoctonia solani]
MDNIRCQSWFYFDHFALSLRFSGMPGSEKQYRTQVCTSGNTPDHKVAWVHYLAAVVFDTVAMGIATFYLYNPTRSTISGLAKVMLGEGLLYFIFLTVANVVNLAMFLLADISAQSSAAVFGQAITMIMSQRIILNLQEWTGESNQGPSRSRSGPDYAMHVLRGETRSNTTPAPKGHDGWNESAHVKSTPATWNNPKRSHHTRKTSSGVFALDDGEIGGVHVVVEREVRYDHDAVSDSERSMSEGKK